MESFCLASFSQIWDFQVSCDKEWRLRRGGSVGRGNLSRAVARKFKPEECLFDFARLPDFNPLPAEAVLPLLAPASLRKQGERSLVLSLNRFAS